MPDINLLNHSTDPRLPLAVSPREACRLLSVGITRLYELIGNGELESYKDGGARRVTTKSIVARVERLAAAAKTEEAA